MRFKHSHTKHEIKVIIERAKEGDASNDNDFKGFNDQLDRIDSTIESSENLIESRTFEIASGGLVVSLTLLSLLRDSHHFPEWGMYPTIAIWVLFTASILLHYWSQFASKRASERMSGIILTKMTNGEKYDPDELNEKQNDELWFVHILNKITPIFLVIGVISLIVFTSYCFLVS